MFESFQQQVFNKAGEWIFIIEAFESLTDMLVYKINSR